LKEKPANSLSSAGEILCCSSLGSSEIRNCNKRFIAQHEAEVATNVWKEIVELGVDGEEEEVRYMERILINEKREDAARRQREQQKQLNQ
jgi:hypothetical protein